MVFFLNTKQGIKNNVHEQRYVFNTLSSKTSTEWKWNSLDQRMK